jgi:hypothetical protein
MSALDESQWALLMAVAARVTPETAHLDAAAERDFRTLIDTALSQRPPAVQKQFGSLLKIVRLAPLFRYGKPFEKLTSEKQDAVIAWFQDAPVTLLRKGMWGLKAMVFMGYYGRPEAASQVGWTPSFDGNTELAKRHNQRVAEGAQ